MVSHLPCCSGTTSWTPLVFVHPTSTLSVNPVHFIFHTHPDLTSSHLFYHYDLNPCLHQVPELLQKPPNSSLCILRAYSLHSRLGDHFRSSLPRKTSQPPSCFSSSDSEPNLRASHDPASAVSLTSSPAHLFTAHNAVAPTPIYTCFSLCLRCSPESHVAHFCTSFRSLFKCLLIKETNLCKLVPVTLSS